MPWEGPRTRRAPRRSLALGIIRSVRIIHAGAHPPAAARRWVGSTPGFAAARAGWPHAPLGLFRWGRIRHHRHKLPVDGAETLATDSSQGFWHLLRFHDTRHSCGTLLHVQGADPFIIQKVLGHSQLSTTRRYTHVPIQVARTALDGLESLFKAAAKTADQKPVAATPAGPPSQAVDATTPQLIAGTPLCSITALTASGRIPPSPRLAAPQGHGARCVRSGLRLQLLIHAGRRYQLRRWPPSRSRDAGR